MPISKIILPNMILFLEGAITPLFQFRPSVETDGNLFSAETDAIYFC